MGRLVTVLIIIGIIALGGGYLWQQQADIEAKAKIERSLADARRSFGDLARSATKEEDDDAFRTQIIQALKTYQDELERGVYGDRPDFRDTASYKKRVEKMFAEGQIPEARRKSMIEGFQIVQEAYETIKKGRWKSIFTQAGPADTRIDIYEMRRIRDDEGNPLLEGRFFLWGVEDSTRVDWGEMTVRYWHTVEKKVKKGRRRVMQEVEEVLGRAEGSSEPRVIIQRPQSYIDEFPPYVSIGYIWLPTMPRRAEKFDLEIDFVARKGGANHQVRYRWKKLPVPSAWQLKEGEAWDADIVEATLEEIAGKDLEEEEDEADEDDADKDEEASQ